MMHTGGKSSSLSDSAMRGLRLMGVLSFLTLVLDVDFLTVARMLSPLTLPVTKE